MYNFFKNQQKLILGVLVGLLIGAGGVVFADTAKVSAIIANHFSFKFDGETVPISGEYTVLNYQGRTYVPARFIAENLGAKVDWDPAGNVISIESKKEECPEPPKKEDTDDKKDPNGDKDKDDQKDKDTKKYSKLPVSAVKKDVWVNVSGIKVDKDDKYTWIYVEVENKGDSRVQLDQRATKLIKDGKTYYQKDVHAVYDYDKKWYEDIEEDEKISGFVKMPLPEGGAEEWGDITLVLRVYYNDGSGDDIEFTFDVVDE